MKQIIVNIERGNDGTFGAYMPEDVLPFGAIGEGDTAQMAKEDFMNVVEDFKAEYEDALNDVEFVFHYDIISFLSYFAHIITLSGLSHLTGINKSQLSQYISGYRHASPKTIAKIENTLHKLGEEFSAIRLV